MERPLRQVRWWKNPVWLLALATLAMLLANVHLVYVAVTSQPDCVAHIKDRGETGQYRAAKSAC